jgi:hypothetical protein
MSNMADYLMPGEDYDPADYEQSPDEPRRAQYFKESRYKPGHVVFGDFDPDYADPDDLAVDLAMDDGRSERKKPRTRAMSWEDDGEEHETKALLDTLTEIESKEYSKRKKEEKKRHSDAVAAELAKQEAEKQAESKRNEEERKTKEERQSALYAVLIKSLQGQESSNSNSSSNSGSQQKAPKNILLDFKDVDALLVATRLQNHAEHFKAAQASLEVLPELSVAEIQEGIKLPFLPAKALFQALTPYRGFQRDVLADAHMKDALEASPAEIEQALRSTTCQVCREKPRDIILLPCRHFVVCNSCAAQLDRCPVCREPKKNVMRAVVS